MGECLKEVLISLALIAASVLLFTACFWSFAQAIGTAATLYTQAIYAGLGASAFITAIIINWINNAMQHGRKPW